jgi:hypothetical protein
MASVCSGSDSDVVDLDPEVRVVISIRRTVFLFGVISKLPSFFWDEYLDIAICSFVVITIRVSDGFCLLRLMISSNRCLRFKRIGGIHSFY